MKVKKIHLSKKVKISLLVVGLSVVFIGSYRFYSSANPDTSETTRTFTRSIPLVKTTLSKDISVTGTVQSTSVTNVTSNLNYKIKEVYVQEGDYVEAGQTLCQLDTSSLEKQLDQLQEMSSSSSSNTTASSNNNNNNQSAEKIANAQKNVDNAKKALTPIQEEYNKIKSSFEDEEKNYNLALEADKAAGIELNKASGDELENAKAKKEETSLVLKAAEEKLNTAKANVHFSDIEKKYNMAISECQKAVSEYNSVKSQIESSENANKTTPETSSQSKTPTLSNGDTEEDIEEKIASCTIKAETSGYITSMNATVGSLPSGSGANGSTLFVIQDTSNLKIAIDIDESDIKSVQTGMKAIIKSDATGDKEITGYVSQISQTTSSTSTSSSNLQSQGTSQSSSFFGAEVAIDGTDSGLLIGMNAQVNIVVEEKSDVFAVPYEAITTDKSGNKIVYVKSDTSFNPVVVTEGMSTDYYVEISSPNLKEGDLIRNSADETSIDATKSSKEAQQNKGLGGMFGDKASGMKRPNNMPSGNTNSRPQGMNKGN